MEQGKLTCVGNFVSKIPRLKLCVKLEPRLLVHLNRKDQEQKDIVSLNKVTSMRRCLNGCSEREVTWTVSQAP